jgi:Pyruvate/2-oxoacid:ferredoxin oxidoreductase gamma subunit
MKHFLRQQGVDFTPFLEKVDQLPDRRFINTFFLGILASRLPIKEEHWYSAIKSVIGKKIDENVAIFRMGLTILK